MPMISKQVTRGMLARKVFLSPDLAFKVHEERIVANQQALENFISNYSASHVVTWLDLPVNCRRSEFVLIIKRVHPELGKYMSIKIWHKYQDDLVGAGA